MSVRLEGLDELPVGGVAGVGDQIHLHEAWGGGLPALGLDGDVMFEQRARLRPTVEAALELLLPRSEAAVDGAGTDRQQLPLDPGRKREAARGPRQPQGEESLEPGGPGIPCRFPNRRQHGEGLRTIGLRAPAAVPTGPGWPAGTPERPNSRFAMVARRGAELVKDLGLDCGRSDEITLGDCVDVVSHRCWAHRSPSGALKMVSPSGNSIYEATIAPWVTLYLS